jgi:hypothetical protein
MTRTIRLRRGLPPSSDYGATSRRDKGKMAAVTDRPLHDEYENYETNPIVIFRFAYKHRGLLRFRPDGRQKTNPNEPSFS